MSKWFQNYQFSHFIPFSEATYFRVFENLNETYWPVSAFFLLTVILTILLSGDLKYRRQILVSLNTLSWLSVSSIFFALSLSKLLPLFRVFIVLFSLSGLIYFACSYSQMHLSRKSSLYITLTPLICLPLGELIFGQNLNQISLLGLAPLPTLVWGFGLGLTLKGFRKYVTLALTALWLTLFLTLRLNLT